MRIRHYQWVVFPAVVITLGCSSTDGPADEMTTGAGGIGGTPGVQAGGEMPGGAGGPADAPPMPMTGGAPPMAGPVDVNADDPNAGAGAPPVGGGGMDVSAGGADAAGGQPMEDPPVACDPADQTADPTPVNHSDRGNAYSGGLEVVLEEDPGLELFTVYRPADLSAVEGPMPILAWGEGACSRNGVAYAEFLAEISSHGYLVLADGEPNGSGDSEDNGRVLVEAIDWAIAENDRPCSQYYRKLDTSKIATAGHSCGGLMAFNAGLDPRVTTIMMMNSGLFARSSGTYDDLKVPLAIINGGPEDIAYDNGNADFAAIEDTPVLLANLAVGHGGTYFDDNGGEYGEAAVAWLSWHIHGDEGPTGKGMFVGAGCGLCGTDWILESKNLE